MKNAKCRIAFITFAENVGDSGTQGKRKGGKKEEKERKSQRSLLIVRALAVRKTLGRLMSSHMSSFLIELKRFVDLIGLLTLTPVGGELHSKSDMELGFLTVNSFCPPIRQLTE